MSYDLQPAQCANPVGSEESGGVRNFEQLSLGKLSYLVADPGPELVEALTIVMRTYPNAWASVSSAEAKTLATQLFPDMKTPTASPPSFSIATTLSAPELQAQRQRISLCVYVQCRFGMRELRHILDGQVATEINRLSTTHLTNAGNTTVAAAFKALLRPHFPLPVSAAALAKLALNNPTLDCNATATLFADQLKTGSDGQERRSRLRTLGVNDAAFNDQTLHCLLRAAWENSDKEAKRDLLTALKETTWIRVLKTRVNLPKPADVKSDLRFRIEVAALLFLENCAGDHVSAREILNAVHAFMHGSARDVMKSVVCYEGTFEYLEGWHTYDAVTLLYEHAPKADKTDDKMTIEKECLLATAGEWGTSPSCIAAGLCLGGYDPRASAGPYPHADKLRDLQRELLRSLRGKVLDSLVCGALNYAVEMRIVKPASTSSVGSEGVASAHLKAKNALRTTVMYQLCQDFVNSNRLAEAITSCPVQGVSSEDTLTSKQDLIDSLNSKSNRNADICPAVPSKGKAA
jgi:hypothetical protein